MARKIIAQDGVNVTPSDTVNLSQVGQLYIGTGGDVKIKTEKGTDLTFSNVADGTFLPIAVLRVFSTDTTASNIILLY